MAKSSGAKRGNGMALEARYIRAPHRDAQHAEDPSDGDRLRHMPHPRFVRGGGTSDVEATTSHEPAAQGPEAEGRQADLGDASATGTEQDGRVPSAKGMSSFYAELSRNLRTEAPMRRAAAEPPPRPPTQPERSPRHGGRRNWLDSSIHMWGRADDASSSQSGASSPSVCDTCGTELATTSAEALATHRRSMAHRLRTLDSSRVKKPPNLPPKPNSSSTEKEREVPRYKLRPSNRGWGMLAGMGWKEGMGLGTAEWAEWQRQREISANIPAGDRASESVADVGPPDLLARTLDEELEAESTAAELDALADETTDKSPVSSEKAAQDAAALVGTDEGKAPPLLTPLPIKIKNNRLGIGRRTLLDPRPRAEKTPESDAKRARLASEHDTPSSSRRTKQQRERDHQRARREWLALRASLQ